MGKDETVDPTTQASLENAAHNAGLSDRPSDIPLTSGDLEAVEAEPDTPKRRSAKT